MVGPKLVPPWKPPPPGWFKVNFDVAVRQDFSVLAVVVRNGYKVVHVATELKGAMAPLLAESCAAVFAIKQAQSLGCSQVIFEGDSSIVCEAFAPTPSDPDWAIEHVLLEGHELLENVFLFWSFNWVLRNANVCAHNLAQWAAFSFVFGTVPVEDLPRFVLEGCFQQASPTSVCFSAVQ